MTILGATADAGLSGSGAIVIAIIGFMQAITLTVLGMINKKTNRVKKDTQETHEQIVNHHTTNYRVESDDRHLETLGWLGTLSGKMDRYGRRLDSIALRLDAVENKIDKGSDHYVSR